MQLMKSTQKLSIIILATLLVFMLVQANENVIGASSQNQFNMKQVQYKVIDSSNNTLTWFNSNYSQSFKYVIPIDTLINVTYLTFDSSNPELSIKIGNLSREGIMDSEVLASASIRIDCQYKLGVAQ